MLPLLLAISAAPAGCPKTPGWTYVAPASGTDRLSNVIRAERGGLTFNNVAISDDVLLRHTSQAMKIEPTPLLVVDTTSVDCSTLQRVENIVAQVGGCPEYVCYAYEIPHVSRPPAPPIRSKQRR